VRRALTEIGVTVAISRGRIEDGAGAQATFGQHRKLSNARLDAYTPPVKALFKKERIAEPFIKPRQNMCSEKQSKVQVTTHVYYLPMAPSFAPMSMKTPLRLKLKCCATQRSCPDWLPLPSQL
jgi:hypothetical protein